MNSTDLKRRAAALRQTFQVKGRLQLEFLASLSKLLREHTIKIDDDLLSNIILAVPDDLINGTGGSSQNTASTVKPPQTPSVEPPQTPTKPTVEPPQTPTVEPPQTPTKPTGRPRKASRKKTKR